MSLFVGFYRGATSGSVSKEYAPQHNIHSPNSNHERGFEGAIKQPPPSFNAPAPENNPIVPGDVKSPNPSSLAYLLPATTYQPHTHPSHEPVPMLDSTEVPRSTSRSPRFREHISELEDTSSPPPAVSSKRWGSVLYADYAGQGPATSEREDMLEEARKRQQRLHLTSLGSYEGNGSAERGPGLGAAGIEATMAGKKAKLAERRGGKKEGEVSPDSSGSPLDRSFVVSPMGSLDKTR